MEEKERESACQSQEQLYTDRRAAQTTNKKIRPRASDFHCTNAFFLMTCLENIRWGHADVAVPLFPPLCPVLITI